MATWLLTPKSIILLAVVAPAATVIVPLVEVGKVTTLESGFEASAFKSVILRLFPEVFEPYLILACRAVFFTYTFMKKVWLQAVPIHIVLPKRKTPFSSAAAAAKSLQPYPALCDPRDSSPPGSPIPGILQARTLEWVAISFSNA